MSGRKTKAVTPRLRFPEFRDAGPWEVRTIEDIAEKLAQGGTPKTSVAKYWNGEIPWITPAEMGDDAAHHYTERTLRTISVEGLQNSSAELLPVNSVIVSSRAPIGYVTINKVEMATNQGCKGIIPKADVYHDFLYFSLLVANQRLNDLGAGAGFKEISASTLKVFPILVPELPEQQKIADCLSSLDDLIRAEASRLEALQAHKKGLMQQLFPREGETTPRLRFPEFRNAGPWEVKRLGGVLSLEYGASLPEDQRIEGPFPVVGSNGVVGHHSEPLIDGPAIVIGRKGSAGEINWIESPCFPIDTTFYVVLLRHSDRLDFIKSLLERHRLPDLVSPGGVPGLNRDDVYAVRTAIPQPEEQQKIADCLSSIDDLIRAQGERIEALKQHKKGLMQQLFPQEIA